jgi:outer membrane protein
MQIEQKSKDLETQQQNLVKFQQTAQLNLGKKRQTLLQPINDRVQTILDEYCASNGIDFVFPTESLISRGMGAMDITGSVIAEVKSAE